MSPGLERDAVYVYHGKSFKRPAAYRLSQKRAKAAARDIWRICR